MQRNIKIYLELRWILECILILILSPFILLTIIIFALLLIFDGKTKPFYYQLRVGQNGNKFKFYKLRTLNQSSDMVSFNPNISNLVSPFCLFLRKHRIDELPQLYNVLRSDMSIIGPRPDPIEYFEQVINEFPKFQDRYQIRPGITGLAQVKLGHTIDVEGAIRKYNYDIDYIKNISITTDIKIILWTLRFVKKGDAISSLLLYSVLSQF